MMMKGLDRWFGFSVALEVGLFLFWEDFHQKLWIFSFQHFLLKGGAILFSPMFWWIFICQVLFLRWGRCFFNKSAVSELAKSTDSGFLKSCPTGF